MSATRLSSSKSARVPLRLPPRVAVAVCAGLLVIYAIAAGVAVVGESPTVDETVHVAAGWVYADRHDYRINPEHPPLWKEYASLPNYWTDVKADFSGKEWQEMPRDIPAEWEWSVQTLYRNENDAKVLVGRSRVMMLILAVALGAVMAVWSWQMGGAVAAVAATALYCLDPNFLGHGPLVTNDVAITLCFVAMMMALWRLGRLATRWNIAATAIIGAIAINVKSTAILLGPVVVLILLARVVAKEPWPFAGRLLQRRASRLLAAIGLLCAMAVFAYVFTWACYGWRFAPSPEAGVLFDDQPLVKVAAEGEMQAAHPDSPITAVERAAWRPGVSIRAILWADRHHLLPQAWLTGMLFNYANTRTQPAFLCGEVSMTGWWYYFPLAMLFKTPLATLAALGLGGVVCLIPFHRRESSGARISDESRWWAWVCLVTPVVVYGVVAMASNMNIGIRHVFPIYVFLFIGAALSAGRAWVQWPKGTPWVLAVLAAGLLVETAWACPNYLSFFNFASGGSRGGIRLLGDSNIDWGQDLKRLAEWQLHHPKMPLYLSYFGSADPAYYDIRYINLAGGYTFNPDQHWFNEPGLPPGVIAISAANLQGTFYPPALREGYAKILAQKPIAVLGGSIYLYEYPGSRHQ